VTVDAITVETPGAGAGAASALPPRARRLVSSATESRRPADAFARRTKSTSAPLFRSLTSSAAGSPR
jgi:hypothetical protein